MGTPPLKTRFNWYSEAKPVFTEQRTAVWHPSWVLEKLCSIIRKNNMNPVTKYLTITCNCKELELMVQDFNS